MKEDMLQFVLNDDLKDGKYYPSNYIKLVSKSSENSPDVLYSYKVKSDFDNEYFTTQIYTHLNKIKDTYCTCSKYYLNGSCKHIAAVLIQNKDIFDIDCKLESNSDYILNLLKERNKTIKKEEVFILPFIEIEKKSNKKEVILKAKIGKNKLYSLIGKFNSFIEAYKNKQNYIFGSDFIYEGDKHYFSLQNERFIEFLKYVRNKTNIQGNAIILNDYDIKTLFKIYQEGVYTENDVFLKIENGFPCFINLTIRNNKYVLSIINKNIYKLTSDCEYILTNNIIYKLNSNQQLFLKAWSDANYSDLSYSMEQFGDIQKNILSSIKEKLILDETTNNIIINNKPSVKLYFDLNDVIKCDIVFNYNDTETNYFKNDINVIRDLDYENEIVNEVIKLGFKDKDSQFILDDYDLIVDFIENKLDLLAQVYDVFTTKKIKNINIIKNNNISSTFSIGKDNILHYDFDLGFITKDEINDVMKALENHKKYYKLTNGSFLCLENDSLKELKNLKADLNITDYDIENGGIIPKYRMLYLDSLKENKYKIIKTNNLFDNFISNFKEFHNVNLDLNNETVLRDYQKVGVKWLYTIYKCDLGGILADEMGLGKTLQTIIFIKKILEENKNSRFLICCPTSLVYNWLNEFEKFAPNLKFDVFSENRNIRHDKLNNYNGNIYITSYGLLREDLEYYKKINFDVFIIDEAQNIKNPHTGISKSVKEIKSNIKFALTGTPIENSIIELWSIFDFIMPGFLSSLTKFHKKYNIKKFDEQTNKLIENLKNQVKPFILRRKKEDVIKDLPSKIEHNIYLDMTEEQKKYYVSELNYVNNKIKEITKENDFSKNKILILSLLTRLRQICINPKIIYDDYKGDNCKIINLIQIIKELVANNHKILVFTSFKTALLMIKEELKKENITSYVIAGDVKSKERIELVDAFNKDNTNVFLIMLKSGGTGLNLTSADIVIHLDLWWNPQVENQATDRTHRIGQTKTVEVIKFICKGTIEEKIIELQEKKKVLSEKILESNSNDKLLENITEDDIRYMIEFENKD